MPVFAYALYLLQSWPLGRAALVRRRHHPLQAKRDCWGTGRAAKVEQIKALTRLAWVCSTGGHLPLAVPM